jgi:Heparinase II/III-like protein
MMKTELFRLKQFARPTIEGWEQTSEHVRLVASHGGYRRLESGVIHRRELMLDRINDTFEVVDELRGGNGNQEARTYLYFLGDAVVTPCGDNGWQAARANAGCRIRFFGVERVLLDEKWVSDRSGARETSPVLIGLVSGPLPLRFGYRLEPGLVTPSATVTGSATAGGDTA